MHELPITQSLLQIALDHAQKANACQITNLQIVIGQLSSFVDDSIQFYWDIISEGTIAQGAILHFKRIPAEMYCPACILRYPLTETSFVCPNCHSSQVEVVAGDEFYLESIDIETGEPIP